jgi:hypothetical protein
MGPTTLDTLSVTAGQLIDLRDASTRRRAVLYEDWDRPGSNEMVLFLKPETMALSEEGLGQVLDLLTERLSAYRFGVESVVFLPSEYLKQYGVIDEHYGVINRLARSAQENLSDEAREKFAAQYGTAADAVDVLGGFEFLARFSEVSPEALEELWGAARSDKLAPGTYCRRVEHAGAELFLVNGFHPHQVAHFTSPGRAILVVVLRGDTSWREARTSFVGATRPQDAVPESLRGLLLSRQYQLGFAEVSMGYNGVHLSAGPVEGLAELKRFVSDLSHGPLPNESFVFGRRLVEAFGAAGADLVVSNPIVDFEGRRVSVFDLTEELDSDPAIERLARLSILQP